jgi:hypothetical protein
MHVAAMMIQMPDAHPSTDRPVAGAAQVAEQQPSGVAPLITVVGKRPDEPIEVIGPAIDRYIKALKERWQEDRFYPAGHQFRIQSPNVCVEVAGLDRESTARFTSLLDGVLARYGVRNVGRCESTITIQFARDFRTTIMGVQRNPRSVGYRTSGGDIADLTRYHLPVRWVEVTPDLGHLRHTWIFIDGLAIGSIQPSALINYISFIALTAPNNDPSIPSVYSIANLFTGDDKAASDWTRLDRAFVRALYSFNPEAEIVDAELRARTIAEYVRSEPPSPAQSK